MSMDVVKLEQALPSVMYFKKNCRDFDTCTEAGVYLIVNAANPPLDTSLYGLLEVLVSNYYIVQRYTKHDGAMFTRVQEKGKWGKWQSFTSTAIKPAT